jgi:uncharacterized protein (UPF0128 family)
MEYGGYQEEREIRKNLKKLYRRRAGSGGCAYAYLGETRRTEKRMAAAAAGNDGA